MDIVLVGTGNTATVLGKKLKKGGHHIVQVFGRQPRAAETLATELGATYTSRLETVSPEATLYLLAVSDSAVEETAALLPFHDKILVHTAASVPLSVFQGKAQQYGVFYPLQSMRKELWHLPEIPVVVDAGDAGTLAVLKRLAATITARVIVADDLKRVKMHLAAVMLNNFTNHLFTLVDRYCRNEGLDFSLFLPLIQETVSRLQQRPPAEVQTGPAARNDGNTIATHLSLLQSEPELEQLYRFFTASIQQHRR